MKSVVIPTVRYKKPERAVEWLTKVLGFQVHRERRAKDGQLHFTELTIGDSMVIVGPLRRTSMYSHLLRTPASLRLRSTQAPYIVCSGDLDAVYQRVKQNGGKIRIDMKEGNYGRSFTASDPEGHLWNIGTYDPWVDDLEPE